MPVDPTQLLPNELLGDCMGHMGIESVLRATHVCARWRAIARASPVFWRTIRLAATSTSALNLFRARITYTDSPGISVYISIPVQPSDLPRDARSRIAIASATIRLELEKHLRRIASLLISAPKADMLIIALSLGGRADILTRLILLVPPTTDEAGDTAMPWHVQGVPKHAPQLRSLVLQNIGIPMRSPARWFNTAKIVKIIYSRRCIATIPADIFNRFPSCQEIEIEGRPLARLVVGYPTQIAPPRDRPYDVVTLAAGLAAAKLLPLIPHASATPVIDVYFTGRYDMNTLVAHLEDPLECSLYHDRSTPGVFVVFTATVPGSTKQRVRVANLPAIAMLDPELTLLFQLTEMAMPRVAKVKVELPDISILTKVGLMSNVRFLAIHVDKATSASDWAAETLAVGWARHALPALERIALRSSPPGLPRPSPEQVEMLCKRLKGTPGSEADSEEAEIDWTPEVAVVGFAPPPPVTP